MHLFLAAFGIVALMLTGCESADDTDVVVEDEDMVEVEDAEMDADEMDAEEEDEM